MGSYKKLMVLGWSAALLLGLSGFEPADTVADNCKAQKEIAADCAGVLGDGAGTAKNVILLIGDGMGIGATYAGRVYISGPDAPLRWERLPHQGLVTTCAIGEITDSAASATTMATGHKTKVGALSEQGVAPYTKFDTIVELMHERKAAGVVSTTSIWDATPAAFVSHAAVRSEDREIAEQMIRVTRPEVILGGGSKAFAPSRLSLKSSNRRDLVEFAEKSGYTVVSSGEELAEVDLASTTRLLGLFAGSGLDYEAAPDRDDSEPHLIDMARAALTVLANDPRGFFLMIEGANIDHAGHATNLDLQVGEMVEFDRTVNLVLDWAEAHPDTLVLITADHETGGIDVLPGEYRQGDKVAVKWSTMFLPGAAGHSSRQVPIYGMGPNAGAIQPHQDDTAIFCIIRNAFGELPR